MALLVQWFVERTWSEVDEREGAGLEGPRAGIQTRITRGALAHMLEHEPLEYRLRKILKILKGTEHQKNLHLEI